MTDCRLTGTICSIFVHLVGTGDAGARARGRMANAASSSSITVGTLIVFLMGFGAWANDT